MHPTDGWWRAHPGFSLMKHKCGGASWQLLREADTDVIPPIQSGKCQPQFSADHGMRWILGLVKLGPINQPKGKKEAEPHLM